MDMPTMADLVELVRSYRKTVPFFACIDPDRRATLAGLRMQLLGLQSRLDNLQKMDADQYAAASSMGEPDPIAKVEALMADVAAEIVKAEDEARPYSIALTFAALPATDDALRAGEELSHEGLLKSMIDASPDGRVASDDFADRLIAACYASAETPSGEPMPVDWSDIARILDVDDWKTIRVLVMGLHKVGSSIPFDPRTSGPSKTT